MVMSSCSCRKMVFCLQLSKYGCLSRQLHPLRFHSKPCHIRPDVLTAFFCSFRNLIGAAKVWQQAYYSNLKCCASWTRTTCTWLPINKPLPFSLWPTWLLLNKLLPSSLWPTWLLLTFLPPCELLGFHLLCTLYLLKPIKMVFPTV